MVLLVYTLLTIRFYEGLTRVMIALAIIVKLAPTTPMRRTCQVRLITQQVPYENALTSALLVLGILNPGATGVIYCTDRAMANGFTYGCQDWVNLVRADAPSLSPKSLH